MNSSELNKLKLRMEDIEGQILGTKGTEYIVSNDDRLKFFKDYSTSLGISPEVVCSIFLMKHINSILNFVKTGKQGEEGITGRINDARNYLLFLQALVEENNSGDNVMVDDSVPHVHSDFIEQQQWILNDDDKCEESTVMF